MATRWKSVNYFWDPGEFGDLDDAIEEMLAGIEENYDTAEVVETLITPARQNRLDDPDRASPDLIVLIRYSMSSDDAFKWDADLDERYRKLMEARKKKEADATIQP
jgi:hypothetical protein